MCRTPNNYPSVRTAAAAPNSSLLCSSFLRVIASDVHLDLKNGKRVKIVHFYTVKMSENKRQLSIFSRILISRHITWPRSYLAKSDLCSKPSWIRPVWGAGSVPQPKVCLRESACTHLLVHTPTQIAHYPSVALATTPRVWRCTRLVICIRVDIYIRVQLFYFLFFEMNGNSMHWCLPIWILCCWLYTWIFLGESWLQTFFLTLKMWAEQSV